MNQRIPPNDQEAEAAVLSSALIDSKSVKRLAAMLLPEDFFSEAHRWIFEACLRLYENGQTPDVVTVATWLRDHGRLAQVGGMPYLTATLNAAPAVTNVVAYARTVRTKSRVRRVIHAAHRILAEGYAEHGDDGAYLARSVSAMTTASRLPDAEALVGNAETLATIVRDIHRAAAIGSIVTGLPTGLDCYDRLTLGLHAKQLTVVGARPGVGKTSFGATIAANVADRRVGVLFFSLEMSREEIISRVLSARSGIDGTLMKLGRLSSAQWQRLHQAAKEIAEQPLWIDDRSALTVRELADRALGAIQGCCASRTALGLIVVDYLQKVAVPEADRRKGRYEQVGDIAKGLKQLARDTGMPVVALAQLRRLGRGETPRRPLMDDLRESGDIEQEADVVTMLHVPPEERFAEVQKLLEELNDFIAKVTEIAEKGPPPPDDKTTKREVDARNVMHLDDGVMVNSAALWPLLEPQWKDPKKWWKELASAQGKKDYDWSHAAARYFPTRVRKKCQQDPSLAVAHRCFWELHPAKAYAWELRLQDEIRPGFTIDEPGSLEARAKFLRERESEAREVLAKETKRRQKRNAEDDDNDGEPLFEDAEAQDVEDADA
jgi:replicative DNA helicase